MSILTDKQIEREQEFLEGLGRINIGAFFLPPIWGPAHGMWATLLFYPLWLFADNTFYDAWIQPSPFSLAVAAIVFVTLVIVTLSFSVLAQPFAAHRAAQRGLERREYLKKQRMWAFVSAIIGCSMIAAATYYNVQLRPHMGV